MMLRTLGLLLLAFPAGSCLSTTDESTGRSCEDVGGCPIPGQACVGGECIEEPCNAPEDCTNPYDMACVDDVCVMPCYFAGDCPFGSICTSEGICDTQFGTEAVVESLRPIGPGAAGGAGGGGTPQPPGGFDE